MPMLNLVPGKRATADQRLVSQWLETGNQHTTEIIYSGKVVIKFEIINNQIKKRVSLITTDITSGAIGSAVKYM